MKNAREILDHRGGIDLQREHALALPENDSREFRDHFGLRLLQRLVIAFLDVIRIHVLDGSVIAHTRLASFSGWG